MTGRSKETLVVGSGASGLTMALLMAKAGRRVRLIETAPSTGGYLSRFTREGRRFDTGFHFTGGFEGVLGEMLAVLGLDRDVRELPLAVDAVLPSVSRRLSFPDGDSCVKSRFLQEMFPRHSRAIAEYYRVQRRIAVSTPLYTLDDRLFNDASSSEYDAVTLGEYLDSLALDDAEVRTLVGLMCVCHGTPPSEVPLTYHCRAGFGLDERIRAVQDGGDAFLRGFRRELAAAGVQTVVSCEVKELVFSSSGRMCEAVRLSDGETVEVDDVFFAVHPSVILSLLPESSLYRSLRRRATRLSETPGFFSVYALADVQPVPTTARLVHYISQTDLDAVLSPATGAYGTGIMLVPPENASQPCTLTAFRTMHACEVPFQRGESGYRDFKSKIENEILDDVRDAIPELTGRLRVLDSATPLTFRRYAPPSGSAYGVKRRIAESRICGRLPAVNLHAIGHNALMPGVVGVMSGAFVEFRKTVGEGLYFELIEERKESAR